MLGVCGFAFSHGGFFEINSYLSVWDFEDTTFWTVSTTLLAN